MPTNNHQRSFEELIDRLNDIDTDNTLVDDYYVIAFVTALLSTPGTTRLDDYYLEMFFELSGLPLDHGDTIAFAARITHFLIGTGELELVCTHDEPSPFCARVHDGTDRDNQYRGAELAASGRLDAVLRLRAAGTRRPTRVTRPRTKAPYTQGRDPPSCRTNSRS